MSTFAVTAEHLTILPHPDADALELAQVGGFRAVVRKGAFQTGDLAIYIPEAAVLPDELAEELGLTGKLAGSKRNRVKAVRLRGELSQGIVCLPAALAEVDLAEAAAARTDFADTLGIVKYVPKVPIHMSGKVEAAPDLLNWIDIENIKRFPAIFDEGEEVIATEKVHGTCFCLTAVRATGEVYVSSKGFAGKQLALSRDETNLYWRTALRYGVDQVALTLADELDVDRVAIFGEVYGVGVQDLHYGVTGNGAEPALVIFDVAYDAGDGVRRFVDAKALDDVLAGRLPASTVLYTGPYAPPAIWQAAAGRETISGTEANLREGAVVRPAAERYSGVLGGRAIATFVSDDYLLRKGGTEFE